MTEANKAVEVFISYSHTDQSWLEQLEKHLSPLKQKGLISIWHFRRIGPGGDWVREIDPRLKNARIILLLVSANLLASNYCNEVEMTQAIAMEKADKTRIIPIILHACDWKQTSIGRFWALPTHGKPLSEWTDKNKASLDVAKGIRTVIEQDFNFSTPIIENSSNEPYVETGPTHASPKISTDPSTPKDITANYKHIKKNHSCDVQFTLSQKHSLKYSIEWHGFLGDKFTLSLDDAVMFDTGRQFLGIPDLKKNFEVENVKGSFFYQNKDNHFEIIITVGSTVIFQKDDSWNS